MSVRKKIAVWLLIAGLVLLPIESIIFAVYLWSNDFGDGLFTDSFENNFRNLCKYLVSTPGGAVLWTSLFLIITGYRLLTK